MANNWLFPFIPLHLSHQFINHSLFTHSFVRSFILSLLSFLPRVSPPPFPLSFCRCFVSKQSQQMQSSKVFNNDQLSAKVPKNAFPSQLMPPNDLKIFGPFSPLGQYSRLSAAASPSSWGSTGSNRWTDEEEDGGGTWKKRTRGEEEEEDEPWRRRRSRESTGEDEKVRRMDEELARLREAPVTVKTVSGPGKFALSIDMNIFRPEDIEVLMSEGRLVVNAEREVLLDERTSVIRRFRRTVAIPDDVGTDAVAVHMSGRGILTITALRRERRIFGGR